MFEGQSLRIELRKDGFAELCFDRRNESINKLDVRTIDELKTATGIIGAAVGVRGVLVTSAKEAFIVGADIFEFTALSRSRRWRLKRTSRGRTRCLPRSRT